MHCWRDWDCNINIKITVISAWVHVLYFTPPSLLTHHCYPFLHQNTHIFKIWIDRSLYFALNSFLILPVKLFFKHVNLFLNKILLSKVHQMQNSSYHTILFLVFIRSYLCIHFKVTSLGFWGLGSWARDNHELSSQSESR